MEILLHTDTDLTLRDFADGDMHVSSDDPHAHFSALQMFAVSLGLCTFSVMAGYGEQIGADPMDIEIRIRWDYVEKPYRIGRIDMDVRWPQVPESRLKAAQRAAAHCTIHNTLHHPPEVVTTVSRGPEA